MPGFYITNYPKSVRLHNVRNSNCVYDERQVGEFSVKRQSLCKFLQDKLFDSNRDYMIIIEGVILNKEEIYNKYEQEDWFSTIIEMYKRNGESFCKEFRGSFSGALYHKSNDEWIVFTNHYGDNAIFYATNSLGQFVIGSQVNYILDTYKTNLEQLNLDEKSILDMLTFGYMEDNNTYAKEIKRLRAGCYLKISKSMEETYTLQENVYYHVANDKVDVSTWSDEAIINELDKRFIAAIKLEYDKDREYGHRHLADLSGGLDSRMNVWVAVRNGYHDMVNLTYCQSNYLDEKIAKQVSRYLGTDLLIRPLDSANFMLDFDRIVEMNYGLGLFSGITGGQRLLNDINFTEFGIEHTGQLGDVVIGSFFKSQKDAKAALVRGGMYSQRLAQYLEKYELPKYNDREVYMMRVRGFQGALSTHLIRRHFTEVASPFLNVEVLDFCMSIPVEKRINHVIYHKWLKKKYPDAMRFRREATGLWPGAPQAAVLARRVLFRGVPKVLRKLGLSRLIRDTGMNPMQHWLDNNSNISRVWNDYFESVINHPVLTADMREKMIDLYANGRAIEKTQCLTALASVKLYFDDYE